MEYKPLVQFLCRTRGLPLDQAVRETLENGPWTWTEYLAHDFPELLESAKKDLKIHARNIGGVFETALPLLMDLDLREENIKADLSKVKKISPNLNKFWKRGVMTRKEFKIKVISDCLKALGEETERGFTQFAGGGFFLLGRSGETQLWHGLQAVDCHDVSGYCHAAGWTYPDNRELAQNENSFRVFICQDDLEINSCLLASGWHLMTNNAVHKMAGGLNEALNNDEQKFQKALFESGRTYILDHEVGHHFYNIRRSEDSGISFDITPSKFLALEIITELMAELFALKALILDALFSKDPATILESEVELFIKSVKTYPEIDQFIDWAAGILSEKVAALDRALGV